MSPVTRRYRAVPNRLQTQIRFLSATVIMSHLSPRPLSLYFLSLSPNSLIVNRASLTFTES